MNTRKLTALVLALALLALPIFSLAEAAPSSLFTSAAAAGRSVTTTVTFEPGDMLAQGSSLAPFADLLKALKFTTVGQEANGASYSKIDIYLQDKPSINFTTQSDKEQFYVTSNLLGEKAVSFTMEDIMKLYTSQLESSMAQAGSSNASMAAFSKMYSSMLKGEMPQMPQFDSQSLQDDLMTPLTEWFGKLAAAPETTTGTFESEKHDTATTKVVYSLTAAQISDLLTILTNWASKDVNLDAILQYASSMNPEAGDMAASKADIQAQLKALPAAFTAGAATKLPEPFTVTTLMDDTGSMKALELNARVFGDDKANPEVSFLAGYYVKTEADGANNQFTLDITSGTQNFSFAFAAKDVPAATQGSDTVTGSKWTMAIGTKESGADVFGLNLNFNGQNTSSAASEKDTWTLGIETLVSGQPIAVALDNTTTIVPNGADVKADGKLNITMAGASVASIVYTSATGEPIEIPAVPADSVQPGKMTAEELTTWQQELSMTAMTQLGQVMQNLPASVMALLSGGTAN